MKNIPDFIVGITVLSDLRQFSHPLYIGLETQNDPSYAYAGRNRQGRHRYIFQYTFSGEGVFRDASGTHTVGSCTAFLCESHDPATAYGFRPGDTTPWRFVFLDFGGRAAENMAQDLIRRFGAIYELPPQHPVIERLLSFHIHDKTGCVITAIEGSKLIVDLLHALLSSKEEAPELQTEHRLVLDVHAYVQSKITTPISVMDIADHLRISREHMTRVFTLNSGMTPYQFILSSKIIAACNLLFTSSLSVKEVSTRFGFENVVHFVRAFKRMMYCTPTEYRKHGVIPEGQHLLSPR